MGTIRSVFALRMVDYQILLWALSFPCALTVRLSDDEDLGVLIKKLSLDSSHVFFEFKCHNSTYSSDGTEGGGRGIP